MANFLDNTDNTDNLASIAIIGMAGRFPGAKTVEEFWQNLSSGVESITFFSREELEEAGISPALLDNPNYVRANGLLEDIEQFDAAFFGLTPREVEVMDPQHRLLLESAWTALESAGYDSENYPGTIGIYGGSCLSTYLQKNLLSHPELLEFMDFDLIQQQDKISQGNDRDYLITRISYQLNLTGPSATVNTVCSTSLVAVHLACQSLLTYQCDLALAGGVSIQVPQKQGYLYREGSITSPDGHCRAFDRNAQGTVFGNGVGLVVLKRLEEALADGDFIYATIRGTAINNDGALKVSYTAPSVEGQAAAIASAQALAGVAAETITYLEAHGTGTALGDPIEIAALRQVFRASTDKTGFCALGSVKPNIGHLNRAAGIAGLLKTALALKHRKIPPSLNCQQPNPQIDLASSPFYINTVLRDWQPARLPRRAGVSSFGFGGTNAHAILEEATALPPSAPAAPNQLLLLSAKTESALEAATQNLARHLRQHPEQSLADIAYTLQVGRRRFSHRRMVVCSTSEEGRQLLESPEPPQVLTGQSPDSVPSVTFMFSGQGSQYANMGAELYQTQPVFRQQVDTCAELLAPHLGLDLRHLLYPNRASTAPEGRRSLAANAQLKQTGIAQPALFVIEYALAQLWQSWGIRPQSAIGHSIGEYVAACLAGVFSLEDALALVAARGQLMQQLPEGAMLAVPLPPAEIQPWLGEEISLALINGLSRSVVSGTTTAIAALEEQLGKQGIESRRLHTSHAFHSAMMDPILEPFINRVRQVALNPPQIPYISNLTGTWVTAVEATAPQYWGKHLRQTVLFAQGLETLLQDPHRILLEVGPGKTLSTLARQHPRPREGQAIVYSLPPPQQEQGDSFAVLLAALGQLWLAGVAVDWTGFYAGERRHRLPLPTYPFERQRYWIDPAPPVSESLFLSSANLEKSGQDVIFHYLLRGQWEELERALERVEQLSDEELLMVNG